MEFTIFTPNYGEVTVKDVMIETDDTNLEDGINIIGDGIKVETMSYSASDLVDNVCRVEDIIESYS